MITGFGVFVSFFYLKYIIIVIDLIISNWEHEIEKTENTFLRGKLDESASCYNLG